MTTELTLESLGISSEALINRLVDRLADRAMLMEAYDEDGNKCFDDSALSRKVDEMIRETINAKIEAIGKRHIEPKMVEIMEAGILQRTNQWGEKKGEPVTFIEYLVERADAYLREPVNHSGKTKGVDSFSWRQNGTRVEYLIDKHLQFSIQSAMESALKNINGSIKDGLLEAVNHHLSKLVVAADVKVKKK